MLGDMITIRIINKLLLEIFCNGEKIKKFELLCDNFICLWKVLIIYSLFTIKLYRINERDDFRIEIVSLFALTSFC